jgi:drug/metabolite transporter (DMT)-like permease
VAYAAWSKAFEKAKQTSSVTNYMFFTPFGTALLGFLVMGEIPRVSEIIGCILIIIGMLVFHLGKNRVK